MADNRYVMINSTGNFGSSGTSGTSGTSGAVGATGSSGTSGAVGATGSSGTSGAVGATGSSGTSGDVGATGSSGTSGVGGGSVDLSTDNIKFTGTAGETLVIGDVVYYKNDGKFWKANASAEATTKGLLMIANSGITADASGEFVRIGKITTTGIVAGTEYYLDTTDGLYTDTKPVLTGEFIRIIGYGLTTTTLMFDSSQDYIELL